MIGSDWEEVCRAGGLMQKRAADGGGRGGGPMQFGVESV